MLDTLLMDQIEMLRVHVENTLPVPLALLISSARPDDGKSIVAAALAESMESAGYPSLLVLADEASCGLGGKRDLKSLKDVSQYGFAPYASPGPLSGPTRLIIPSNRMRQTFSRENVSEFIGACRESYAITIIETAAVLHNSFAALATGAVNGVVLTIREGRRVCGDDRRLSEIFARDSVPFLGVVSVDAKLIANSTTATVSGGRVAGLKIPSVSGDLTAAREEQTV